MSNNLGFPEGTTPRNTDPTERSLQKINAILDQGPASQPNVSTTKATILQGNKTVAATATPERLVAESTLVDSVEIVARKGRGLANTGDVWIGPQDANDAQLRRLANGDAITLTAPVGKKIDLFDIFLDVATNGDGVIYTAIA
jgi:hypothetical protein